MKKQYFLVATLAIAFLGMGALWQATGQEKEPGMFFEKADSWADVKAKAKRENKFIFVDAYTTWCGPCKAMAKNIFPKEDVGQFFNANYINLKVQLDTTAKDNEAIKQWYADAHQLMVQYDVKVFPTYLFFSPDGELVHRAVGASDAAAFIKKGKNALDPTLQYYTLQAQYLAGKREPQFLQTLTLQSMEAYDQQNIKTYAKDYFATQTNLYTEDNIKFAERTTMGSGDKGFEMMLTNPEKVNKVLGEGKAQRTVRMIVMQEDIFPIIFSRTGEIFTWPDVSKKLVAKYPKQGEEMTAYAKVFYTQQQGDWEQFAPAVTDYMAKYGTNVPAEELNSFAFAVFENCSDINCVEQAISWAKRATNNSDDANYFDTYANLLYKSGKRAAAIKAQEQTIALAKKTNNSNLSDFESTLEKMKKGEKNW